MKERPIIMSGNHPKLILDGIKTQTRRVIKPQPEFSIEGKLTTSQETINKFIQHFLSKCPYGQVGDRLWVRETWKVGNYGGASYCSPINISYRAGGNLLINSENLPDRAICLAHKLGFQDGKWRPSIFMPRWASRILLEITEVRVERLQEITEEDALAEGIEPFKHDLVHLDKLPEQKFRDLWDSLNAKRGFGWNTNPWVWVISSKLIQR